MNNLPESTQLLYSQLLTQCLHGAAPSGHGLSFVSKQLGGAKHWYLQVTIGSRKTQHYLGPDTPQVLALINNEKELWKNAEPEHALRESLVAMLISGGALSVTAMESRVFELLERAGVFLAGGVVVGSHAFGLYANMLGVKWQMETTRTQDVDIASDYRVVIGVPNTRVNLREALIASDLGFIEVPALDRKSPSTKFRIRGQPLSVDVLTPMLGKTSTKPIPIAALNTFAEPMRFLDYLIAEAQPGVIVARAGILVNVPAPARFALHKLVIAGRRVAAFQTKSHKDIRQADQLINLLAQQRPGDIRQAWEAAMQQPKSFIVEMHRGLKKLSEATQQALKALKLVKTGA